jgi:hypothetical protein
MKKQTAVEWLIDKLSSQPIDDINDEYWFGIIGQAKQMEKEQIIDAYKADLHPCSDEDAEQYFNETYNNEK